MDRANEIPTSQLAGCMAHTERAHIPLSPTRMNTLSCFRHLSVTFSPHTRSSSYGESPKWGYREKQCSCIIHKILTWSPVHFHSGDPWLRSTSLAGLQDLSPSASCRSSSEFNCNRKLFSPSYPKVGSLGITLARAFSNSPFLLCAISQRTRLLPKHTIIFHLPSFPKLTLGLRCF